MTLQTPDSIISMSLVYNGNVGGMDYGGGVLLTDTCVKVVKNKLCALKPCSQSLLINEVAG